MAIGWIMLIECKQRTNIMRASIIPAFVLLASLPAAAEVRIPNLDVEKACKSVSSLAVGQVSSEKCLEQENAAKADLQKSWTTFQAGDRERCTGLATAGGYPSYIELLTCVQMARDARNLEQKYKTDTGQKCPEPLSCPPGSRE
jgi:hypothetical protein